MEPWFTYRKGGFRTFAASKMNVGFWTCTCSGNLQGFPTPLVSRRAGIGGTRRFPITFEKMEPIGEPLRASALRSSLRMVLNELFRGFKVELRLYSQRSELTHASAERIATVQEVTLGTAFADLFQERALTFVAFGRDIADGLSDVPLITTKLMDAAPECDGREALQPYFGRYRAEPCIFERRFWCLTKTVSR